MTQFAEQLFSWLCGQNPQHTWLCGGEWLPLCQRCAGVYLGAAVGAALHLVLRPRPTSRFLWTHGLLLLQMVPQGLYLVPQSPVLRTVSGLLFGVGLVAFLCLPLRSSLRPAPTSPVRREGLYGAAVGVALIAFPAAARHGGAEVASALTWLALAGCLALAVLVPAALIALAVETGSRLARSREPAGT